jgi:hypothetical protein
MPGIVLRDDACAISLACKHPCASKEPEISRLRAEWFRARRVAMRFIALVVVVVGCGIGEVDSEGPATLPSQEELTAANGIRLANGGLSEHVVLRDGRLQRRPGTRAATIIASESQRGRTIR